MNPITSPSPPSLPVAVANPVSAAPAASIQQAPNTDDTVDLSSLGRALAALDVTNQAGDTASAGAGSELSEEAQRLMEFIQELQQQLQEKQQELMAIMADSHLSQEAKLLKLAEVQATIGALTSNLMSTMNQLLQMLEVDSKGA